MESSRHRHVGSVVDCGGGGGGVDGVGVGDGGSDGVGAVAVGGVRCRGLLGGW